MRSVGVRELRQRASELLRAVEAGETVEVTDRGRPVAQLVPLGAPGVREALVQRGQLIPASADLLELGPPLTAKRGRARPSKVLERLRADER